MTDGGRPSLDETLASSKDTESLKMFFDDGQRQDCLRCKVNVVYCCCDSKVVSPNIRKFFSMKNLLDDLEKKGERT